MSASLTWTGQSERGQMPLSDTWAPEFKVTLPQTSIRHELAECQAPYWRYRDESPTALSSRTSQPNGQETNKQLSTKHRSTV